MKVRWEYRINKKGAECYRTNSLEDAKARLDQLSAKRPGIYTMQSRTCHCNRVGTLETDASGRPLWTCWS